MPHCIIEFSKDLESQLTPPALVNAVHQGALASELFEASHIKTRAVAYDYFQVGAEQSNFIHVTVRLHQGRTVAQKKMLSSTIIERLADTGLSAVVITVEAVDIETESYTKRIV
ncbi:5-carboxymethyl-2-hydroxymuconate Delta-isomerase [Methylophaga sp. OBS4]|uniref:5-carboxymethyl-2-hydroxymuconate Delta-isomerase n=1 Tax=Methylophaga sp. OBS4 TaxID=2991935 RepID=UPI002252BC4C|nr:5-carboxymethyl-2-hydroxymuconate Delta-isomerase [Methylophaga sp. OBS4]MCX4187433.1 5-carboxymethyl-2-hydroxymuconate Delta-isomerase [Methylophaga sp. OBS4]